MCVCECECVCMLFLYHLLRSFPLYLLVWSKRMVRCRFHLFKQLLRETAKKQIIKSFFRETILEEILQSNRKRGGQFYACKVV